MQKLESVLTWISVGFLCGVLYSTGLPAKKIAAGYDFQYADSAGKTRIKQVATGDVSVASSAAPN